MENELTMLVKAQLTLCRQLIGLGKQQREFILKSLRQQMHETVKAQETAFHKFMQIEEKKRRLMQPAGNRNPRKAEASLDLQRSASGAYEEELRRSLEELRKINRINEKLVENEVRFIDFNINIMTQTTADDIYAPQGQGGSVISKKKMFDQTI